MMILAAESSLGDFSVVSLKDRWNIMKDVFGVDLAIGDIVAFNPPRYKGLITGKVVDFTLTGVL